MRARVFVSLAVGLTLLSGCGASDSHEMSMQSGQTGGRAPEIDKLAVLIGSWEGTGECKMEGEANARTSSGKSTISWDADRTVALERFEGSMGEAKFSGLGLWTWNSETKKFNVFWIDNYGSQSHGEATFDDSSRTFKLTMKGVGPMGKTVGEGTTKVSDNTMEWTYSEWSPGKSKKLMDMKGTSRRLN